MLRVSHVSKRFGKVQAVNDVSFHVKKGSTFAFLGTNGAGKSTVIHMIIDLLTADEGEITFTGGVLQEVTGIVFQTSRLDEELTLEENLILRAKLYGMRAKEAKTRVNKLLELTNLFEKRKRLYGKCSGGEKRKTDIIRALLHQPHFLILDEPTTGLDPESREEIWSLLRELQTEHALTIFLTTHYIEEAEDVDYVLMMHEGKVEVEGTPTDLRTQYSKTTLTLHPIQTTQLIDSLNAHRYSFKNMNDKVSIELEQSKDAILILREVEDLISSFSVEEASLENVFLKITEQIKNEVSI